MIKQIAEQPDLTASPSVPHADEPEALHTASETQVWEDFLKGSDEALAALYSRYANKLYHYGTQITVNKDLAFDVVQDVFLYMVNKRHKLSAVGSVNSIGKKGDLNEWLHDWEDADPQHRHVSHLYGLHPYDEITPWGTPELAAAARQTLAMRGDGGTGWSRAWKINFWARLGDGDHALLLFKKLLQPAGGDGTKIVMSNGGTYPNLFCAHPPFQIDGNFGGTAGLIEMLFQSQGEGEVMRILPALPGSPSWQSGSVSGMRARGGFVVDFQWEKGRLKQAQLTSTLGGKAQVLLPANTHVKNEKGKIIAQNTGEVDEVVSFETMPGAIYTLSAD